MVYEGIIAGQYVDLRSAAEDDAEFTLLLRRDPDVCRGMPRLEHTVEQQREWICRQRMDAESYFFVAWDKQGRRIGTISIYNIAGDAAEMGRIAMKGNALQTLEAKLLATRFAFYTLGLERSYGYVFADNTRAIKLARLFGNKLSEPMEQGGRTIYKTENARDDFSAAEKDIKKFLYRDNGRV